jgi:hypothetical protein
MYATKNRISDRCGHISYIGIAVLVACFAAAPGSATTVELVTNGGFETGGFAGWTVTDQAGGSGSWFQTGAPAGPLSTLPTVGPHTGSFYAVSDQTGPGAHALTQSIAVGVGQSSVIFSFDMFIDDWGGIGPIVDPSGLDFTSGGTFAPNQFATVDLLAPGTSPLSTTTGVLSNFFVGATPFSGAGNPYIHYAFDITSLVAGGGAFDLRFAEVDNENNFLMGIDNVSVLATSGAPIPEPATLSLLGLGLVGLAARARRRTA